MSDITYCTNEKCKAECKRKDHSGQIRSYAEFQFVMFKGVQVCDHIIQKYDISIKDGTIG